MATATAGKTQDLPPPGGYKPITFKRVPPKSYFSGWALIGGYLGITAGAAYIYYLNYKVNHNREVETRSAEFAVYPILLAERDREYLKQLRRNRDEEAKLMANVEGWKVGTLYGEPIYKKYKKDELLEPDLYEYYVHADPKEYRKRACFALWT